jgi:o-succinylbenzoate---CoA ligase
VRITSVALEPYALPLAAPVPTVLGPMRFRRGWLVRLHDDEGRRGFGDAAPWPGFGSSEEAVAGSLGALVEHGLAGEDFDGVDDVAGWLAARRLPPEAAYAVELALLDLLAQRGGVPLARLLSVDAALAAESHALWPRTAPFIKIKVGSTNDQALVASVRAAAPAATLRLDAGGRWTPAEASEAIARLARYRIAWIEQPIPPGDVTTLASLRAAAMDLGIAIAVDEGVRSAADVDALADAKAADAVVVKPMFAGGLLAARDLCARARARGLEAIVTNALESAIGRTGTMHLAAGLPGVHGLGSALAADIADAPPLAGGRVALAAVAGLGVAPACHDLPNPLRSSAIARADHPAVVHGDQVLTYAELADRAARGATALARRGLHPGSVVALDGPRDAAMIVAIHAVAWLGAAVAPLPAQPAERARVVRAVAPDAVVATHELADAPPAPERFWPRDEVRAVIATSGTTGTPRAVRLSTTQIVLGVFGSAARLGHDRGDRWLSCLPLEHVSGLAIVWRAAWLGTTVVLHDRFDAERVAAALDGGEATLVSLVPSMLAAVLDARPAQPFPPSLRAVLLGGAAAGDALLDRCRALAVPVARTWGMTEAGSQVATAAPGEEDVAPLPFARVDAVQGRLRVCGPLVGGAIITADRGRVDEHGHVHVLGRADDLIVSGGEKIAPAEVEAVLHAHPAVREAVVVAVPSARWGERPVAVLVPAGAPALAAELAAFCRQRLAPFKVPDEFVWCERLPRGSLGKVSRARVRELVSESRAARSGALAKETVEVP